MQPFGPAQLFSSKLPRGQRLCQAYHPNAMIRINKHKQLILFGLWSRFATIIGSPQASTVGNFRKVPKALANRY
jgi:hypothetical protein